MPTSEVSVSSHCYFTLSPYLITPIFRDNHLAWGLWKAKFHYKVAQVQEPQRALPNHALNWPFVLLDLVLYIVMARRCISRSQFKTWAHSWSPSLESYLLAHQWMLFSLFHRHIKLIYYGFVCSSLCFWAIVSVQCMKNPGFVPSNMADHSHSNCFHHSAARAPDWLGACDIMSLVYWQTFLTQVAGPVDCIDSSPVGYFLQFLRTVLLAFMYILRTTAPPARYKEVVSGQLLLVPQTLPTDAMPPFADPSPLLQVRSKIYFLSLPWCRT